MTTDTKQPVSAVKQNPLLSEKDLIEAFCRDIEALGLVGEKDNAAIAFLCGVSALTDDPLNLTVQARSSAGKNFLLERVADFLPEEHKKFISGMTPKTLMYAEKHEFQHKAVFIAEYEGVSKADYSIRTLQSEKAITWDYVETSSKGIKKKSGTVLGPAAFLQATTRPVLHPENETRNLFVNLDESQEQTRAILMRQAASSAGFSRLDVTVTLEFWHELIRGLENMQVVIPFAEKIATFFPVEQIRSRRDFPKLMALIRTNAFLHQHIRQRCGEAIIAAPEDYMLAKRLFECCHNAAPEAKLAELLEAASRLEGEFAVADVMDGTGWGHTKTYELLERAKELGCVAPGEARGKYRYIRNSAVPPLALPETI